MTLISLPSIHREDAHVRCRGQVLHPDMRRGTDGCVQPSGVDRCVRTPYPNFARLVCGSGKYTIYNLPLLRIDWAAEYFQHRNVEDLYLNDVSWYAEQNPEHFAFHIGEQVSADCSFRPTGFLGLLLGLLNVSVRGGLRNDSIADPLVRSWRSTRPTRSCTRPRTIRSGTISSSWRRDLWRTCRRTLLPNELKRSKVGRVNHTYYAIHSTPQGVAGRERLGSRRQASSCIGASQTSRRLSSMPNDQK
jgi:hypothetical protein